MPVQSSRLGAEVRALSSTTPAPSHKRSQRPSSILAGCSPIRKRKQPRMVLGRCKTRHGLLLLSLLFTVLDTGAAGPLHILTAPMALNGSNDQIHGYHCNNLPSWTGASAGSPTYTSQDCIQAIHLFETDVGRNPGQAQWLSLKFLRPLPGYGTAVWTPKRYTSGEFTDSLSIAYLKNTRSSVCKSLWIVSNKCGARHSRYVRTGDRKPRGH